MIWKWLRYERMRKDGLLDDSFSKMPQFVKYIYGTKTEQNLDKTCPSGSELEPAGAVNLLYEYYGFNPAWKYPL